MKTATNKILVSILLPVILVLVYYYKNSQGAPEITKENIQSKAQEEFVFPDNDSDICPILPIKYPDSYVANNSTVLAIINDETYRLNSVKRLSEAVQINTVIFDEPPDVSENPGYWSQFEKFHRYLRDTFPLVYEHLEVQTVNTYGLYFLWEGKDPSLKPIMLNAHQDVVPVQEETLQNWQHPPFDGHYDGKYLYGRGSSDCKNSLIAVLEALELLIVQGFQPNRSIIAAFGFDEESGGIHGASKLSEYIEKRHGTKSIYAIIDEGVGFTEEPFTKSVVAVPFVAEKGFLNVNIMLKTLGGHSWSPPPHTSIGIMSQLVNLLEENPFQAIITSKNPFMNFVQCLATHYHAKLPKGLAQTILQSLTNEQASNILKKILDLNPFAKYFIRTSQGIDIIRGGEKANALPESTLVTINHRIAVESSIEEVVKRITNLTSIIAQKHNLGVIVRDEVIIPTSGVKGGHFEISIDPNFIEPSPITSTNDTVWEYLVGVTRHLMEDLIKPETSEPFLVSPMLMPANTDTRHYQNVTDHIFRYAPGLGANANIHSVDEYIEFDYHLHLTAFYFEYIQTIDSPDADNK